MSRYRLTPRADRDLEIIWKVINENNGPRVADRIEQELLEAMLLLAEHPGMGHVRPDVRNSRYRFWSVYNFVIAYRPDSRPLMVARVLHGAQNFKNLFR